jgi:hypothetical protein
MTFSREKFKHWLFACSGRNIAFPLVMVGAD